MRAGVAAKLFRDSGAERWGLTLDAFRAALDVSVAHAFAGRTPTDADVDRYLTSLHANDLALAAACAAGLEPAWDHFVLTHRPGLYRAADAIDPSGGARDLADALYADLYGLRERDGVRQSLFRYFHGRSRLATWLAAVLSQRHVDRLRSDRRLEPLPDDETRERIEPILQDRGAAAAPDPERPRFVEIMRRVLTAAIAALAPRDRLRLACYYAQDMTLAAIGRMLGEHEGTVSRNLTRTRATIRADLVARLRQEGLQDDAIEDCIRSVMDDAGTLDVTELIGPPSRRGRYGEAGAPSGKNRAPDRSR